MLLDTELSGRFCFPFFLVSSGGFGRYPPSETPGKIEAPEFALHRYTLPSHSVESPLRCSHEAALFPPAFSLWDIHSPPLAGTIAVMAAPRDESPEWDKTTASIASLSSDDLYNSRPNRWRGTRSTWLTLTREDRSVYETLEARRNSDLAVHLYNAFALKKGKRRKIGNHGELVSLCNPALGQDSPVFKLFPIYTNLKSRVTMRRTRIAGSRRGNGLLGP